MTEKQLDADWVLDALLDAEECLDQAIRLLQEDPRHIQGVLEHEIPALYAKLNYAVNTSRIGPSAVNEIDHDKLIAWPEAEAFKVFSSKE